VSDTYILRLRVTVEVLGKVIDKATEAGGVFLDLTDGIEEKPRRRPAHPIRRRSHTRDTVWASMPHDGTVFSNTTLEPAFQEAGLSTTSISATLSQMCSSGLIERVGMNKYRAASKLPQRANDTPETPVLPGVVT
jgi:hypothetical protein